MPAFCKPTLQSRSPSAFGDPQKGADQPQGPLLFPGLRAQAPAERVIQRQHTYNPVPSDAFTHVHYLSLRFHICELTVITPTS